MTRGEIMRGLSMAMTLQNVTGRGSGRESSGGLWRPDNSVLFSRGGVVSGVTSGTMALCCNDDKTYIDPDWTQGYEVGCRFLCERTTGHQQTLFGSYNQFKYAPTIDWQQSDKPYLWCGHSDRGGSGHVWEYELWLGYGEIDFGIWYDTWISWKSGILTLGVKALNGSYSDEISASGIPAQFHSESVNRRFGFGGIAHADYNSATYTNIDLSRSYIKINGVPVWGAGY